MALRVCSTPGCPTLIPAGQGRCGPCARIKDKARGSRQERGYDAEHDRARAAWAPIVAKGTVKCRRCNEPISSTEPWDLGHPDTHCPKPRAPEHERCNRATNGR